MSKYPRIVNGEGIELDVKKDTLHFACCDCGLVHRIAFAVEGDVLGIAMERHSRATAQLRRHEFGGLHNPASKGKFKIIRRG